jgi:molybdopterin-binding protein
LVIDGVVLARFAEEMGGASSGTLNRVVVSESYAIGYRFSDRVVRDTVMAQVEIQSGHRFVSLLSREAADDLGLEPGVLAVAAVKATNVSVEIPRAH